MNTPPETAFPGQPGFSQVSQQDTAAHPAQPVPDPDNPPWNLLEAFLVWLASVFLLILPQLIAIPYLIMRYQGQPPTSEVLLADKTFILISLAGILPAHGITLALAWAVVTRLGRVSAKRVLGWNWKAGFGLLPSVGSGVFLFLVAWVVTIILGGQKTELERILQSSRAAALLIAFLAVATAPLVEEIVYRGVLFPALQRTAGSIPAILIVTLLFAAPHIPQYWPNVAAISSIALLSIVLTTIRARTGRLLPCFIIHLVFNGVSSLIIVFEPYLRGLWSHPQTTGGLAGIWCALS